MRHEALQSAVTQAPWKKLANQPAGNGCLLVACLLFKLAGCEGVLMRKNIQAMKPITGIQVPKEKICATLTPIADNSSIPVSVKYT